MLTVYPASQAESLDSSMGAVVALEAFTKELAAAARTLRELQQSQRTMDMDTDAKSSLACVVSPSASTEVHEAWRRVVSSAGQVQRLLGEGAGMGMVQHVAIQVCYVVHPADAPEGSLIRQMQAQLMGCLQWLGEFRVLACIPRSQSQSVAIADLAELCSVPETQLARVVRMMATAGFLCEPQPGRVAHTAASQQFATKPSVGDAAMFVTERVAMAAGAGMVAGTRDAQAGQPRVFDFSDAPPTPPALFPATTSSSPQSSHSLHTGIHVQPLAQSGQQQQQPRLQRQWAAFMQHAGGGGGHNSDEAAADVLTRLDWANLGGSRVVDMHVVGAEGPQMSLCNTLASRYPQLQIVAQRAAGPIPFPLTGSGGSSTITMTMGIAPPPTMTIQTRTVGDHQPVRDAAVYMLRLPHASAIAAELRVHLPILAASPRATLLLVPTRLLPEPGTVDMHTEAAARMRDLSLAQLTGQGGIEHRELCDLIAAAKDRHGGLHVVSELRARNNVLVALRVCYQAHNSIANLAP
jgi:hypothetical protein